MRTPKLDAGVRKSKHLESLRTYLFLEEGAAVVVEDGREVLAVRRRSQAVVQCQRDGGQFVPELIILLTVEQKNEALYMILTDVVFCGWRYGNTGSSISCTPCTHFQVDGVSQTRTWVSATQA